MHEFPTRRAPSLPAVVPLFVVAALVAALVAAPAPAGTGAHGLDRHLPPSPLFAAAVVLEADPAERRGLADELGRLLDDRRRTQLAGWLAAFERSAGVDLDDELVPALGPQIAFSIDFPPIDGMLAVAQLPDANGLAPLFARCGFVARVRDGRALTASLAALGERLGTRALAGGVTRVDLPLAGAGGGSSSALPVYHAVRRGVFAVGFDEDWVRRAAAPPADGPSLSRDADFARVFANLDSGPVSWSYVNLPGIRRWLEASQVIALLVAGDATLASVVTPLLDPSATAVGVGWTSVVRDGGVRTSRFGPDWTSGLAVPGGMLAAMMLVEQGDGDERAAIRETLGSIRTIAEACERFSEDIDGYPGPTDGWIPVDRIALFLEPVYAASLPREDSWGNPILYRSDGASYRLISLGRDGRMDRDWSDVDEVRPGESPDSDILFADGRFVVLPPQIVSE